MSRNLKTTTAGLGRYLLDGLTLRRVGLIVLGAMICTFGIHNIHQQTGITEGGVMGLMLLIEHWLGVSPAFITPVLDLTCYLLAFKYLGGRFIKISVVSTLSAKTDCRTSLSSIRPRPAEPRARGPGQTVFWMPWKFLLFFGIRRSALSKIPLPAGRRPLPLWRSGHRP